METQSVSVSESDGQRADVFVEAAGWLFVPPDFASRDGQSARELGMSDRTIYRRFPDKRSLLAAVLDHSSR